MNKLKEKILSFYAENDIRVIPNDSMKRTKFYYLTQAMKYENYLPNKEETLLLKEKPMNDKYI